MFFFQSGLRLKGDVGDVGDAVRGEPGDVEWGATLNGTVKMIIVS